MTDKKKDFTKSETKYLVSLSRRLRILFIQFVIILVVLVFLIISDFYCVDIAARHLGIHGVGEIISTAFRTNNYEGTYSGYYILFYQHFYKGMQEAILAIVLLIFYLVERRSILITRKLWDRMKDDPNSNGKNGL